jgi:hypothetical protein
MRVGPGTYIYGDEIFEGLTHLQPLNVQVTGVKEVVDPGVAFVISLQTKLNTTSNDQIRPGYLRLRDLIVMVWESKINSPRMDVHIVPEDGRRHNGAFNMPSRTSRPPWR